MINVNFGNCEKEKDISGLWQYDYGRTLLITGLDLPEEVKVDFTLKDEVDSAIPRTGITQDGITIVAIPNVLLANEGCHDNYYIRAYIYVEDEEKGYTYRKITMRVRTRVKPGNYEVPDEEPDYVLKQLAEITKTLEELKKSGVVMELDATLTLEGKAADAKATGEAIQKVSGAIPAKTSDLQNDSDFQTSKEVQSTVNAAISNITHFHFEKVEELPETGEENVIYLVKKTDSEGEDIYEEYLFVDGAPELIGSTKIDLSGFALKTEIPQTLPNPKKLIFTGAVEAEYNGSEEKTINIPEGGMTTEQTEQLKKNAEEIDKLTEAVEKCIKEESDPTVPAWAKNPTKPTYTADEVGASPTGHTHDEYASKSDILTKTSELTNDSDFQTGEQVRAEIGKMTHYTFEKVNSLEEATNENVIYLVPNEITDTDNIYDEYLLVDGVPELIGSTAIDLSGYVLEENLPKTLPNPKKLIFTGAVTAEYDGSEEQTINIPESSGGGMTEEQISLLNGKIDSPQTAEVGQVLSVKAVDENGKPTEWEVVNMASGGVSSTEEWVDLGTVTVEEGEEVTRISWDLAGRVKKIYIKGHFYSATSGKYLTLREGYETTPIVAYDDFKFPESETTKKYFNIMIEEMYAGYWIGMGGASTFSAISNGYLSSHSSARQVSKKISLGAYWNDATMTAGTSMTAKVVYY